MESVDAVLRPQRGTHSTKRERNQEPCPMIVRSTIAAIITLNSSLAAAQQVCYVAIFLAVNLFVRRGSNFCLKESQLILL